MNIFRKLVHCFAWKQVSRTSKQVSRNLGPLWQPGVYNDTNRYGENAENAEGPSHPRKAGV